MRVSTCDICSTRLQTIYIDGDRTRPALWCAKCLLVVWKPVVIEVDAPPSTPNQTA